MPDLFSSDLSESVNLIVRPVRRTTTQRRSQPSVPAIDDMLSCSQQSIFSAMDRFIKSVNNVSATVLVPSKLRDMDIPGRKRSGRIPAALMHQSDLYSFYLMLDEVKKDLLWGPGTGAVAAATTAAPSAGRVCAVGSKLGHHVRQPSDESLPGSTCSDPDTDSEVDSLLTDRDSLCVAGSTDEPQTCHLAAAFRHHMQGLHTILHQLADSADYLCLRYQEEIDAPAP